MQLLQQENVEYSYLFDPSTSLSIDLRWCHPRCRVAPRTELPAPRRANPHPILNPRSQPRNRELALGRNGGAHLLGQGRIGEPLHLVGGALDRFPIEEDRLGGDAVGNPYVGELHERRNRARALGWQAEIGLLGAVRPIEEIGRLVYGLHHCRAAVDVRVARLALSGKRAFGRRDLAEHGVDGGGRRRDVCGRGRGCGPSRSGRRGRRRSGVQLVSQFVRSRFDPWHFSSNSPAATGQNVPIVSIWHWFCDYSPRFLGFCKFWTAPGSNEPKWQSWKAILDS